MPFTCLLCSAANTSKTFSSKNSLSIHERTVHPNNKIIPHSRCLTSPSLYDIHHFKHSFIMQLKARLQFHRSKPKVKTLKMESFFEGLLLFYFIMNQPFNTLWPEECILVSLRVVKDMNNWVFFLVMKIGVAESGGQGHVHMF